MVVYKNENIFNVSIGYRNTTGSLRYKGGSGKLQATKESSHSFSELSQTSISIPWTQWKHKQYNNFICVNLLAGFREPTNWEDTRLHTYLILKVE